MLAALTSVVALATAGVAGPVAVRSEVACPTGGELAVARAPLVPVEMPAPAKPTAAAPQDVPPVSLTKALPQTAAKGLTTAPAWVVSAGGGLSSPTDTWVTGAVSLSTRVQLEMLSPFYVGVALFGTLPRSRTFGVQPTNEQPQASTEVSWYRVRAAAEMGMQVRVGRWGGLVGGGLGGGVLVEREIQVYQFDRPDAFAFVQARLSYALDAGSSTALWLGMSFDGAFLYRQADQAAVGATPNSRYEGALLAGVDFSILD